MAFEELPTMSEHAHAEQDQRREHVRRMLLVPASVCTPASPQPWKVRIIDVGRGGVSIVTEAVIEVGAQFELSFHLPNHDAPIVVEARSVYAAALERGGFFRVGARFTTMSEEAVSAIVDFVTAPRMAKDG